MMKSLIGKGPLWHENSALISFTSGTWNDFPIIFYFLIAILTKMEKEIRSYRAKKTTPKMRDDKSSLIKMFHQKYDVILSPS